MKRRRLGADLAVVLWAAFVAIVAAAGFVLLRACGLPAPLAWNFCPVTPAAPSGEAARGTTLREEIRRLELELAQKALACASIPKPPPPPLELPKRADRPRPQQTAQLKPPPPPPPPPKPVEPPKPPAELPADRWAQKDLSMLRGCWVLGHETGWNQYGSGGRITHCTATAGTLCLDDAGNGRTEMSVNCPTPIGISQCRATARAQFAGDGTLRVQQPRGLCSRSGGWYSQSMVCNRVSDAQALCHSIGERGDEADLEFRRTP